MKQPLSISGYSTALFSTWIFIEELGILFDAGDGVSAGLVQKSHKIKHVFISHADRDHLNGLFQLTQLNARPGFPKIHYPKDCGSFPAIKAFTARFDPHVSNCPWVGIKNGERIEVAKGISVVSFENRHVVTVDNQTKSLGYQIFKEKRKLKSEFAGLPGKELAKLRQENGDDFISERTREILLTYSGDTPVFDGPHWNGGILIHEATFIDNKDEDAASNQNRGGRHSVLETVIKKAATSPLSALILTHFSTRYKPEAIDERIVDLCKETRPPFPVYRILPGETVHHLLSKPPIYPG